MRVRQTAEDLPRGPPQALLRERHILQLIPVSRATFRRWLRDGRFPAAFKLYGHISVWRAGVVYAWIDQHDPACTGGGPS
jgi:predicted DNA-binding transcriptional regulator AlpA